MSELTDTINAINTIFAQSGDVPIPPVNESMSVADYLTLIDQLQSLALAKVDDSISAALQAASAGFDVSLVLQQLYNYRESLLELRIEIHQALGGFNADISLQDAWNTLVADEPNPDEPPDPVDPVDPGNNPPPPEPPPPVPWPDDGTVVLYGTVPMLLRKNDAPVPSEFSWTHKPLEDRIVSPLISTDAGSWKIGTQQNLSISDAVSHIKTSTIDAAKDLIGAAIGEVEFLSLPLKAHEAYELGDMISNIGVRSIDFIGLGLDVLNNQTSIGEFNQRFDSFSTQTRQTVEEKALSETASRFPNGNWWATPIVDKFFGLIYQLRETNSFELEITGKGQAMGGNIGGVILGSFKNDTLIVGNGRALAAGGDGDDLIIAGSGQQWIVGNSGIDTVKFAMPKNAVSLRKDGDTWHITALDGSYQLQGVERLQFNDRRLALDLEAGQSGGDTVRLLVAALGKEYLTPDLIGLGITAFDQGLTLSQAAAHLLTMPEYQKLLGSSTNETFVARVFKNVTGAAPDNNQLSYFTGLLQGSGGTFTQADLLSEAALSGYTEAIINLIGISSAGIEFI